MAGASAQEAAEKSLAPEFIHLTTEKPFYFEEDRIIFQAIALSRKTFNIVKRNDVLFTELLNTDGEQIAAGRFLWKNGIASGELKLPLLFDEKAVFYLHVFTPSLVERNSWVETSLNIDTYQIPVSKSEENSLASLSSKKGPSINLSSSTSPVYTNLPNEIFYSLENLDAEVPYRVLIDNQNGSKKELEGDPHMPGSLLVNPRSGEPLLFQLLENETIVASDTILPSTKEGITLEVKTDSLRNLEIKINSNFSTEKTVALEIKRGAALMLKRNVTLKQAVTTIIVPTIETNDYKAFIITVKDAANSITQERFIFPSGQKAGELKWINQRNTLPSGSTPNLLFLVNADSVDLDSSYLSIKLMDKRLPAERGTNLTTVGQAYSNYQLEASGLFTQSLPDDFEEMTSRQKEAWLQTHRDQLDIKKPIAVPDSTRIVTDPFQKGFKITGRITLKESGEPLAYCPLALANTSDFSLFRFGKTTKEGYFKFENLTFEGENELFLALQKYYDQEVNIVIDQQELPQFDIASVRNTGMHSVVDKTDLLNEALERSTIDSVYTGTSDVVKAFQENNFISKIAGFFLEPTKVVDPLEYVPFSEMKDIFKEILPSAYLRFKKGKPLIRMVHNTMQLPSNAVVSGLMEVPALVIVDGVPIFNQAEVLAINPANVTKYELYHGLFTLGYEVYLGLVHIVTNVDYLNKKEIMGLHKFKYQGINVSSGISIGPKGTADNPYLSPVGFWITTIKPDEKGVIQLPIRLTSVPGQYWLSLEAITSDGRGMVKKWPLQIE